MCYRTDAYVGQISIVHFYSWVDISFSLNGPKRIKFILKTQVLHRDEGKTITDLLKTILPCSGSRNLWRLFNRQCWRQYTLWKRQSVPTHQWAQRYVPEDLSLQHPRHILLPCELAELACEPLCLLYYKICIRQHTTILQVEFVCKKERHGSTHI